MSQTCVFPILIAGLCCLALDSVAAPVPWPVTDGPHAVGTTVWHVIDDSRADLLTERDWDKRELMVRAWYPAAQGQAAAVKHPDAAEDDTRTNAVAGAGLAPTPGRLPVVMIAPGRGVPASSYWSLAESLASHGYVIVGVDSPHSGRVTYPDGRVVRTSPVLQPPAGLFAGDYARVDAFFEPAARAGAKDLIFVLNRLTVLDKHDPAGRFSQRLALDRVGVFGHSLGGRIAGAAVAADARFVALLAMEGIAPRAARRNGLDAAVAILLSAGTYPYAIENVREFVPNRRNDVFIVTLENFEHNSVTDMPLLAADGADPAAETEALALSGLLARRFFDRYLGRSPQAFDTPAQWPSDVRVAAFPAPATAMSR